MHWSWFRIVAAITGLSGVVAGFIVNVDRAARQGHGLDEVLANYFSLFTIVSTLLAVVTLLVAASWGMRHAGTEREPLGIALVLAAVTGPVLLLGLVYNALLRGLPAPVALGDSVGIAMLDSYAAEVLHVVLPIYFLLDLLLAPHRRGLPWWSLAVLVGFPLDDVHDGPRRARRESRRDHGVVVPVPVPRPARSGGIPVGAALHRRDPGRLPGDRHRDHRDRPLPGAPSGAPRRAGRSGATARLNR
jgi:hypothetical protein